MKESYEIVETLLKIIKQRLEDGEDGPVSGFGKFTIQEKPSGKPDTPLTMKRYLLTLAKLWFSSVQGSSKSGSTTEKVKSTAMHDHHRFLLSAGYTIVFITAAITFLVLIAMDIAGIHRTVLKAIPVTTLLVLVLREIRGFHRNKYNLLLQYRGHHENF